MPIEGPQTHCLISTDPLLASADPQIAFANEVVAAMKNRLPKGRALAGMARVNSPSAARGDFPSRLKQAFRFACSPRLPTGRHGARIATFHAHHANYFFPDAMA